jgi:hypothetical protein
MRVSFALQVSATQYTGNSSTVTPYPIAFPIVSMEHVAVTVQTPSGTGPVVALSAGQFTVHDLGNGTYNVTTATAYGATTLVTVFRSVPFDQPFEFPEGSIFRTSEVERAFDRVVMQMHQLWRLYTGGAGGTILPGAGTTVRSLAVWSDATARTAVVPSYTGQVGVQISDDTVWIAQSVAAGDWQVYSPPTVDVWTPDMVYRDDVPDTFVTRWVGVCPANFKATHLRLSSNFNTGKSMYWKVSEGPGSAIQTLAEGTWTAGVTYTILVPVASWGRTAGGDVLAQGTLVTMLGNLSGAYGTVMNGLQVAFIGRWIA